MDSDKRTAVLDAIFVLSGVPLTKQTPEPIAALVQAAQVAWRWHLKTGKDPLGA